MKDHSLYDEPAGETVVTRRYGYHRIDGELVRDDWVIVCDRPGAIGPFTRTRVVTRGEWVMDASDERAAE